ncbi:alpha/beta hydrolase family protein [Streptomyces sp. NPDC059650]|uniref:alpha/beta hydrolase family protein n=1 Tax=Streptomyces sp. NPDC059650 TaxID=3346896 RepID=UPI0036AA702A
MNRRRTTAAAALSALLLPLVLTAAGTASAAGPAPGAPAAPGAVAAAATTGLVLPELPRPSGRFAVGQETLHLVDHDRTDPWAGSGPRELMVTLRYPAHRGTGGPVAPYLTGDEARLLLADRGLEQQVPAESLAGTGAYARSGARPVAGRHPLVVLSPGFTVPRATLTALAEELASRGYVVAAVDHAYETAGTSFPGGRVLTCKACEIVQQTRDYRPVADNRARDVSFLLDRLTGRHSDRRHAGLIDRSRIAVGGHSMGGSTAAAVMAADPRVRAGFDMDGGLFSPVPQGGLHDRPFLLLGGAGTVPGSAPDNLAGWDVNWPRLDGWKRWITFADSHHFTFTDWPAVSDDLGLPRMTPLPGDRSVELTRRFVGAFLDLHLRGIPQPLLDGPAADVPEARFHQP